MYKKLKDQIAALEKESSLISPERKEDLRHISEYIRNRTGEGEGVDLVFICTHNSRRSHMAQIWAQAAASYFGISRVNCYSGGTEATAFHPNAVRSLGKVGFRIEKKPHSGNPEYRVSWSDEGPSLTAFSKKFSDESIPAQNFAAIMTCSDADEACPFVPGAETRFSTPYEDPKKADGTPRQEEVYDERCREVGREMVFVFANVRT